MFDDLIYHPTMGDYVLAGCRVYLKSVTPRYALRGTVVERLDSVNVLVRWDHSGETRIEVTGSTGAIGALPEGLE